MTARDEIRELLVEPPQFRDEDRPEDGTLEAETSDVIREQAADDLLDAYRQQILAEADAGPFRPRMELGWNDCDPIAECHCGARLKGDSVNDALIAWGKHLTTTHRGEW